MPKVTQLVGGSPGPKPGPSEAEMRAFFLHETPPEPKGAELRPGTGQLRPPHWGCLVSPWGASQQWPRGTSAAREPGTLWRV